MSTIEIEGDVSPYLLVGDLAEQYDDMMRPQTTEKFLFRGSTPTFNFSIKSAGMPYDLTGLSLSFAAKATTSDSLYLFNQTPTINSDPKSGLASLTFTIPGGEEGNYIGEVAVWNGANKVPALQFPFYLGTMVA